MNLNLTIDSMPLAVEIDDVVVGLLAVRLNLAESIAPTTRYPITSVR